MDADIELLDDPVAIPASTDGEEIIEITDSRTDRYNTFGFISWWKQEVVRDASVMVIGAGALGNEVLKNLALMGVGRIFIVDFDTIEDSNLSRSILYRASDNGRKKAEVAAEAVREINPDVAVQWLHADINHELGLGVYRRMDAIIGCLDNREARLSINRACWKLGKPWVDGAIQELLGIARVFEEGSTACYECTLKDEDYRIMQLRESCNLLARRNIVLGKTPTTPTIASIIGSVQTQEALKLLHGMQVNPGQALVFSGLLNEVFKVEYARKEGCQSHWKFEEVIELPQASAATTTAREILTEAALHLGPDVSLQIPRYVMSANCSNCHLTVEVCQPLHLVGFPINTCPQCQKVMDLEGNTVEFVSLGDPLAELTLKDLGIPPLDIVPVRNYDKNWVFLELSGDADGYFEYTYSDAEHLNSFYDRRRSWQTE